jgi:hypothetical protein
VAVVAVESGVKSTEVLVELVAVVLELLGKLQQVAQ